MKSCAVFGHRGGSYAQCKDAIKLAMSELVQSEGVTQFFCGGRGNFDNICARTAFELKSDLPQIKIILVLSYHPANDFELPKIYDESVYILERKVPPLYAIVETNKAMAERADFVLSGVNSSLGGAYEAIM